MNILPILVVITFLLVFIIIMYTNNVYTSNKDIKQFKLLLEPKLKKATKMDELMNLYDHVDDFINNSPLKCKSLKPILVSVRSKIELLDKL